MPKTEVWYCWKQLAAVASVIEGQPDEAPRLLTPWGDPDEYEYPADALFETVEKAIEWKKEFAPQESWWLAKKTLEPIAFHPGVEEED